MANGIVADIIEKFQMADIHRRLKGSVFVRHVSATFITRMAIMVIGFASSIVTARYLGPEGKGVLVVLMTITGVAVQFGNFGLHASNTYFVAKEKERLPRIVGNTLWPSLIGGSIVSLITLGILYFNQNLVAGIPLPLLMIALFSIPFSLFFMLGENILLGIQKIKAYNVFELTKRLVTFLAVSVLLVLLSQGVGAVIATTTLSAIVFSFLLMKNLLSVGGKFFVFDPILFKKMIRYGLKAYLAALFIFLVIRFDMLMVNYFLGAGDAGVYSISVQVADLLYMLPVTIGMILFPKVSGMKEGKWEFTKKTAWVTSGIMFIICSMAALLARPFIVLLYGDAFAGAVGALWWLLPGIYLLSINTIYMNFFAGKGMPIIVVISPLLALAANFILNIYFIPVLGINGASLTSSIAYMIMLIASIFYLRINDEIIKE
jgi:O-antigen/teichoic acid export membrane protein